MDATSIDVYVVIVIFLLLLIGIGPKIALVPFLELTAEMDEATKKRVAARMLRTAGAVAMVLVVLGEILTRLLHFSTGALSVAAQRRLRRQIRCSSRYSRSRCPTC